MLSYSKIFAWRRGQLQNSVWFERLTLFISYLSLGFYSVNLEENIHCTRVGRLIDSSIFISFLSFDLIIKCVGRLFSIIFWFFFNTHLFCQWIKFTLVVPQHTVSKSTILGPSWIHNNKITFCIFSLGNLTVACLILFSLSKDSKIFLNFSGEAGGLRLRIWKFLFPSSCLSRGSPLVAGADNLKLSFSCLFSWRKNGFWAYLKILKL